MNKQDLNEIKLTVHEAIAPLAERIVEVEKDQALQGQELENIQTNLDNGSELFAAQGGRLLDAELSLGKLVNDRKWVKYLVGIVLLLAGLVAGSWDKIFG